MIRICWQRQRNNLTLNTIHTYTCNYMPITRHANVLIPHSTIEDLFFVEDWTLPTARAYMQRTLHVVTVPSIHSITWFYMVITRMQAAIISRRPEYAYAWISDCHHPWQYWQDRELRLPVNTWNYIRLHAPMHEQTNTSHDGKPAGPVNRQMRDSWSSVRVHCHTQIVCVGAGQTQHYVHKEGRYKK